MMNTQAWLSATRPRTLPLALSSILMGSFLAASHGSFSAWVLGLCALTTIFLQVLSNLANDYGDSIHGADSEERTGPSRAVQSGEISAVSMKRAVAAFALLSLLSGVALLMVALGDQWVMALGFLALGMLSIAAAIKYTMGKNPYGYAGLGDVSVLFFFGLVGVGGTYYLHVGHLEWSILLPAITSGLFATAVLNVNNIRDIASDLAAGKHSIPVRIGRENAIVYHWAILALGFGSAMVYALLRLESFWELGFVLALPLLIKNGLTVQREVLSERLDPMLKQMALTTFFFTLLFGMGQVLGL